MAVTIQLRRDTTTNWSSKNPILHEGEIGYDTSAKLFKIGNGLTAWNDLTYFANNNVESPIYVQITDPTIDQTIADGSIWINPDDASLPLEGPSAYEVAVNGGFIGSEAEWLATLVGPQGPQGEPGPQGLQGPQGEPGTVDTSSINLFNDVDTVTTAPAIGQALVWDGSNWIPSEVSNNNIVIFNDYYTSPASQTSPFTTGLANAAIGAVDAADMAAFSQNHPGIICLKGNTGTTSGSSGWLGTEEMFKLEANMLFEAVFRTPTDPADLATVRYTIGFNDSWGNIDFSADGATFWYDGSTNIGQFKTANNNSKTTGTNSVGLSEATWYKVSILINSDVTSASLDVRTMDNTSILSETISSNLPVNTTGARVGGWTSRFGSYEPILFLDYIRLTYPDPRI